MNFVSVFHGQIQGQQVLIKLNNFNFLFVFDTYFNPFYFKSLLPRNKSKKQLNYTS